MNELNHSFFLNKVNDFLWQAAQRNRSQAASAMRCPVDMRAVHPDDLKIPQGDRR